MQRNMLQPFFASEFFELFVEEAPFREQSIANNLGKVCLQSISAHKKPRVRDSMLRGARGEVSDFVSVQETALSPLEQYGPGILHALHTWDPPGGATAQCGSHIKPARYCWSNRALQWRQNTMWPLHHARG